MNNVVLSRDKNIHISTLTSQVLGPEHFRMHIYYDKSFS